MHVVLTYHIRILINLFKNQEELANQGDYTLRAERELKQRHSTESRQMPKNLKLKEQDIRKQFRDAVRTQTKQYKLLKEHVLLKTPKVIIMMLIQFIF